MLAPEGTPDQGSTDILTPRHAAGLPMPVRSPRRRSARNVIARGPAWHGTVGFSPVRVAWQRHACERLRFRLAAHSGDHCIRLLVDMADGHMASCSGWVRTSRSERRTPRERRALMNPSSSSCATWSRWRWRRSGKTRRRSAAVNVARSIGTEVLLPAAGHAEKAGRSPPTHSTLQYERAVDPPETAAMRGSCSSSVNGCGRARDTSSSERWIAPTWSYPRTCAPASGHGSGAA